MNIFKYSIFRFKRFFKNEQGPALWKWTALETLFVWVIGAILWLIYGKVVVAEFAGAGMILGIAGAFVLFVTTTTRTFFVMALVGIIDFLSFFVPLGSALSYFLGSFGVIILIAVLVGLNFVLRKLGYRWNVPMWQTKEINETGIAPELHALILKKLANAKQ